MKHKDSTRLRENSKGDGNYTTVMSSFIKIGTGEKVPRFVMVSVPRLD